MHIGQTDVLIAGGGPAAAAAAIMLRASGAGVVLVERTHYEDERVGETVGGEVLPLLHALGCGESFLADGHEPAPELVSCWGSGEAFERNAAADPFGSGWHLDRGRFDCMLAARAEEMGSVLLLGARVTSCQVLAGGGWRTMVTAANAEPIAVEADFVVDATGRSAALARFIGCEKQPVDRLVALVAVGIDRSTPCDPRTMIETAADGWWYSASLPGSRAVFVRLSDADLLQRSAGALEAEWRGSLGRTLMTQERAAAFEIESLRLVSAVSHRLDCFAGDSWIAVGDAAFACDPLAGQGIIKGLESGIRAAAALAARDGSEYATWARVSFERYLNERRRYYALEERWPESPFWKRRR